MRGAKQAEFVGNGGRYKTGPRSLKRGAVRVGLNHTSCRTVLLSAVAFPARGDGERQGLPNSEGRDASGCFSDRTVAAGEFVLFSGVGTGVRVSEQSQQPQPDREDQADRKSNERKHPVRVRHSVFSNAPGVQRKPCCRRRRSRGADQGLTSLCGARP